MKRWVLKGRIPLFNRVLNSVLNEGLTALKETRAHMCLKCQNLEVLSAFLFDRGAANHELYAQNPRGPGSDKLSRKIRRSECAEAVRRGHGLRRWKFSRLGTQTYVTVMWCQEGLVKYDLDSSCPATFQLAKRWARLLGKMVLIIRVSQVL